MSQRYCPEPACLTSPPPSSSASIWSPLHYTLKTQGQLDCVRFHRLRLACKIAHVLKLVTSMNPSPPNQHESSCIPSPQHHPECDQDPLTTTNVPHALGHSGVQYSRSTEEVERGTHDNDSCQETAHGHIQPPKTQGLWHELKRRNGHHDAPDKGKSVVDAFLRDDVL